jgi:hypothetical protein
VGADVIHGDGGSHTSAVTITGLTVTQGQVSHDNGGGILINPGGSLALQDPTSNYGSLGSVNTDLPPARSAARFGHLDLRSEAECGSVLRPDTPRAISLLALRASD